MSYLADLKEQARGRWASIIQELTTIEDSSLDGSHHPCPLCGGTDRFRFDGHYRSEGDGGYYCSHCGPGSGFDLVMKANGWDFPQTMRSVAEYLPHATEAVVPSQEDDDKQQKVRLQLRKLLSTGVDLAESQDARAYLAQRGLSEILNHPVQGLSWHNSIPCGHNKVSPGLVAKVCSDNGELVTVHRTMMMADPETGKYPVRRLMSPIGGRGASSGCAVQLFSMRGQVLGIAEGIETALGAYLLGVHRKKRRMYPVWAALNATNLRNFVWPEEVRYLVIRADNDKNGVGQQAAHELAARAWSRGVKAYVTVPSRVGDDWNDVWKGQSGEGQ